MAHFAKLDENNIVLEVHVVNNEDILDENGNESEEVGVAFLRNLFGADTNWKQTSYNGNIRKNYAGIGYTYDSIRDAFISPCPYPSWVFNEETYRWEAPVVRPEGDYVWNELEQQWDSIE